MTPDKFYKVKRLLYSANKINTVMNWLKKKNRIVESLLRVDSACAVLTWCLSSSLQEFEISPHGHLQQKGKDIGGFGEESGTHT